MNCLSQEILLGQLQEKFPKEVFKYRQRGEWGERWYICVKKSDEPLLDGEEPHQNVKEFLQSLGWPDCCLAPSQSTNWIVFRLNP